MDYQSVFIAYLQRKKVGSKEKYLEGIDLNDYLNVIKGGTFYIPQCICGCRILGR